MSEEEIAAIEAAIAPEVPEATRNAIRFWAAHTWAQAGLLDNILDGHVVVTGYDPTSGEPSYELRPIPEADRATPEWIETILRKIGVYS